MCLAGWFRPRFDQQYCGNAAQASPSCIQCEIVGTRPLVGGILLGGSWKCALYTYPPVAETIFPRPTSSRFRQAH
jgi:hypothetical protein